MLVRFLDPILKCSRVFVSSVSSICQLTNVQPALSNRKLISVHCIDTTLRTFENLSASISSLRCLVGAIEACRNTLSISFFQFIHELSFEYSCI